MLEGAENLEDLGDSRLREYAVYALKDEAGHAKQQLEGVGCDGWRQPARTRERHAEVLARNEGAGLVQMFIETTESLERELRVRAIPN